ncbi:MAG: thioredoxin family protein [Acidobacteria bacterium]|nr:thioredoxin family protein [Acidobacteriota bacterium]
MSFSRRCGPISRFSSARCLITVAALVAVASAAAGQQDPVKLSLRLAPGTAAVAPGSTFRVQLVATMDEGWHLYSITQPPGGPIATRITVSKGQVVALDGKIDAPAPRVTFDQNFGLDTELYDGEVTFVLPLRVAADASAGSQKITVETYYQTCNDQFCLPPKTVKTAVEITIEGPAPATSGGGVPVSAPAGPVAGGTAAGIAAKPAASERVAAAPADGSDRSGARAASESAAASQPAPAVVIPAPSSTATAGAAAGPTPAVEGAVRSVPAPPAVRTIDMSQSLWSFLWLAMTMGALALLTPCVFPMIPVTVSYFTSQAAGSRKKAVGQALTYMVGIILTFTALGMAMALLVGATGLSRFASSPWVNLLLGALFVGFALNLFGFYEIRIPSGLLTRLDAATRQSGGSRIIGTLLMALTFTLASISCTAPFIGTLLVMAAGGDWQWPLVGMLAFSTVLAFPFFILALMPQLLASLPRSGGWMNSVKVLMGFLVIAASTKFLSNADVVWGWGFLTRDIVLGSWVAITLLMMTYILGMFRFQHDSPVKHVGIVRLAVGLVCGTLAFWLASGLTGKPLGELDALLPLPSQSAVAAAGTRGAGELTWLVNDYAGALAEAQRTNRRLFVDFTGYTCTNCKWMETNMFPRDDVRRELERFVRVRLYTDGDGGLYEKQQQMQQEKFKTVALPYYAVLEADGTTIATFPGLTRDPAEFVRFLRQAQAAPTQPQP